MKQHLAQKTRKIGGIVVFICSFSVIFGQQPQELVKKTVAAVHQLPAYQNFKKNKLSGLHLFNSSEGGFTVGEINRHFGYISKAYEWLIPPQYDYAYAFHEGFGIVLKNGQYTYVDAQNQQPFKTDFAKDLGNFKQGRALFKTHSGKVGMFNKQGQIVADTVFKKIYLFDEEVNEHHIPTEVKSRSVTVAIGFKAITHKIETPDDDNNDENDIQTLYAEGEKKKETIEKYDYALIDTNGRFVVPFGLFKKILPFDNGYAFAYNDTRTALYNTEGKEVFNLATDTTRAFNILTPMTVKHDLIKIFFNKKTVKSPSRRREGLIDFKGNIVFNDTMVNYIADYDDKKAIVRTDGGFSVIFFEKQADKVIYPTFSIAPQLGILKKYGVDAASASVSDKQKWGIVDSCFHWKVPPQYDGVQLAKWAKFPYFSLINHLTDAQAAARHLEPSHPNWPVTLHGLADGTGKILFETEYGNIHPNDAKFTNFSFTSADGATYGRMDKNGKIFRTTPAYSNTATDTRRPFYVFKTFNKEPWSVQVNDERCKEDTREALSMRKTCNTFKKITNSDVRESKMAYIDFKENDTTYIKIKGNSEKRKALKAQFVNNTTDTLFFETDRDNQLIIKVQAQDTNGVWRDISVENTLTPYEKKTQIKQSLMGLPPQYFWEISLPTFEAGRIKTKCRGIIEPANKNAKPIISDTWEATINPAQFWRTPAYDPQYTFRTYGSPYE
jgi:hypothetical protein